MRMILRGFGNLLRLEGRDSSGQFWPFAGFILIAGFWTMVVSVFVGVANGLEGSRLVRGVWMVAMVLCLASATTRRLHDRGLPGKLALIPVALAAFTQWRLWATPPEGALRGSLFGPDPEALLVTFGAILLHSLAFGLLIIALALPGKPAPNRYGPPPSG